MPYSKTGKRKREREREKSRPEIRADLEVFRCGLEGGDEPGKSRDGTRGWNL